MNYKGFTLVELIVVILLIGIMSVFVIPKFDSDGFKARGLADEVITSIRHAQRLAMTRGEQYKIDISPTEYQVRKTNGDQVRHPSGKGEFLFVAPDDFPANLIQSTESIEFNSLGQPVKADSSAITIDTDISIPPFTLRIEEETGYAHLL